MSKGFSGATDFIKNHTPQLLRISAIMKHEQESKNAVKEFKFAVDKTDAIDNENHIVKLRVIEGGFIGSRLKSCSFEIEFSVGSTGDTVEKIMVVHETLDDTPLTTEEEDQVLAGISIMTKAIEEYLLANPTAYA